MYSKFKPTFKQLPFTSVFEEACSLKAFLHIIYFRSQTTIFFLLKLILYALAGGKQKTFILFPEFFHGLEDY